MFEHGSPLHCWKSLVVFHLQRLQIAPYIITPFFLASTPTSPTHTPNKESHLDRTPVKPLWALSQSCLNLGLLRLEQALTSLLTVQGHLPRMTLAPLCACLRKLKASRRKYSLFQPAPEGRGPASTPHWEARSLTNISTDWQIQMGFILVNALLTFCNFSHPWLYWIPTYPSLISL